MTNIFLKNYRRALHLLKSHNSAWQEGIWNSTLTAKVAERVLMIEEQGLIDDHVLSEERGLGKEQRVGGGQGRGIVLSCKDVPDWARISDVEPIFVTGERRAWVRFVRAGMRVVGENGEGKGMDGLGMGMKGKRAWEEVVEW